MDSRQVRETGEILRAQATRDAKTLGPGSIERANRKRLGWGLKVGGMGFPASVEVPTLRDLGAFVAGLGLDLPAWYERTARYASGPVADFMALAESVKARRRDGRMPRYLGAARARTWKVHEDLGDGVLEALEELRFDDPRAALKATRGAFKVAAGPSSVGRVLAVHASNLREVDSLGDALLALAVAIPALDVAGDAWGMGRALAGASAAVHACGEFKAARRLIDEAEGWHVRAGSVFGRASALSWRGILALRDGHPRAALRELDAALALFPAQCRRSVAGIHQIRAHALLGLQEVAAARRASSDALALAPDARVFRGRLAWRAADVESAAGDHAAAEALYEQAFGLVSEPLCDRLLIAAQAVRAATRQGATMRALTLARSLLGPLFECLDDTAPTQRLLRAAHLDLYRAALDAGLSADVLERSITRIKAARAARQRRVRRQIA